MSRFIELAQEIDKEMDSLRYEIDSVNLHAHLIEEQLRREKAKNRAVANMLRELADRIEREEI